MLQKTLNNLKRAQRRQIQLELELESFCAAADMAAHRERDPVRFVHRFQDPADQEVVGLFSALLAYGRAALIGAAIEQLLERLGQAPATAAQGDDEAAARARFEGFVYRLTRGCDLSRLWLGAGALLRQFGSLHAAVLRLDAGGGTPDLGPAMSRFRAALVEPTAHFAYRRAFEHLMPDPARGSACKRWWLYFRWMVRGPDEVDLGLWRDLDPARLLIPLDTHTHRLGRYLGLTERSQAGHKTAMEITEALRRIDPVDPIRFDFALAHMGISGACPTRRVQAICDTCPIHRICRQ